MKNAYLRMKTPELIAELNYDSSVSYFPTAPKEQAIHTNGSLFVIAYYDRVYKASQTAA